MHISFLTGVIAACSAVLGFALNFLVIMVRVIKRKTMTTFQLLLAMIAFNDMILSLLFGFISALMLNNYEWIYHPSACKLLFPTATHFMSVNVGCIFTVSYERYRAIVHPFKPRFSIRRTIIVIVTIWMLSIACLIPNIVSLRMQSYGQCRETWDNATAPKIYSICLLLIIYVLPLSSMTFMHVMIGLKLRRTRSHFEVHRIQGLCSIPYNLKRNIQTFKLLISIVVAFSLLILPTKLYYVIWDLAPGIITENAAVILNGYKSLYYIHVIVNPILYSLTNSQFKRDLKDVMRCRSAGGTGETLAMKLQSTLPT